MREVISLRQAIAATLQYFDLFDFALTLGEVEEYLYGWNAPKESLAAAAKEMPEVSHRDGFYFLRGRDHLAARRKNQRELEKKLWKKAERFSFLLAMCPFVRMAAVCNSLSYGNVTEKSDIDLFVVTETGRLFTAQFFLKFLTQSFGMRVHHSKIAGRYCLSFFVTEKALNLAPLAHDFDPHLAYFAKMMVPLTGEKTYARWLAANGAWTLPYFKRPLDPRVRNLRPHRIARIFQWIIEKMLCAAGSKLDEFFRRKQSSKDTQRRKQAPRGSVVISKDVYKFHEDDPRGEIAEKFQKRLEAL